MRVCIEKSTGKLIESQSGLPKVFKDGDDNDIIVPDAMIGNAVRAGYDPSDVEVRAVTEAEFKQLLVDTKPALTYSAKRAKEMPGAGDMIDAIMKSLASQNLIPVGSELEALEAARQVIKTKYPKPI